MKVVHIITCLDDGGAEAVLYRLCTHATSCRHSVVSLREEGKYGPLLRKAGIEVYCLNMRQGRVSLNGLVKLWQILRTERPDVVQTWMYHADLLGGVISRLAGIRNVCWGIRHSILEPGKSRRSTIWVARLCAALSRYVPRRIVCCAHRAAEIHQDLGYAREEFVVIPNGYDLRRFQPDIAVRTRLRREWGVDPALPLIGTVGRFHPQKDPKNLIDALGHLQKTGLDFRVVLVGNGFSESNATLLRWLESQSLLDRTLLLGARTDVSDVMNALDIFVLSSLGEAFPNVLAEAMACGTPCVTTDAGDAALIVGDTGWVVPPRDSSALAHGISNAITLLQDQPVWQVRKRACRERIDSEFGIEKMVRSYIDVWGARYMISQ